MSEGLVISWHPISLPLLALVLYTHVVNVFSQEPSCLEPFFTAFSWWRWGGSLNTRISEAIYPHFVVNRWCCRSKKQHWPFFRMLVYLQQIAAEPSCVSCRHFHIHVPNYCFYWIHDIDSRKNSINQRTTYYHFLLKHRSEFSTRLEVYLWCYKGCQPAYNSILSAKTITESTPPGRS